MRLLIKRIVSVVVLIVFLAGLIYIPKLENAYAAVIDDVGDLNLAIDTPVTLDPPVSRSLVPNPIPQKPMTKNSILVNGGCLLTVHLQVMTK